MPDGLSFNRDIVECKEGSETCMVDFPLSFNRDIVECKIRLLDTTYFAKFGLIAP